MQAVVAGVDSSTQSCTVELRDAEDGTLLGVGRAPHPPTHPPVSEQRPEEWWRALVQALGQARAASGVRPDQIRALSVGAQCHGLVMLDRDGRVLRPAMLWNDLQSAPQAARLRDDIDLATWARTTGLPPTAALTLPKLMWVAEHEPHHLHSAHRVLLPHDWLGFELTGRPFTDRSEASGTGYFRTGEGVWDPALLERYVDRDLPWSTMLPAVLGPQEVGGVVRPDVAEQLGISGRAVVGPGGGDQHLAVVGLGVPDQGTVLSIGTSGVVIAPSATAVADPTGAVDGVADATGAFLGLACTLNATKVTDTFARLLGVQVRELSDLALAADSAADRPVLLAYLDGERAPSRPDARGLLADLSTHTTREQLALAAIEGVVMGMTANYHRLSASGAAVGGLVVAAGGGARSGAYLQLFADHLARPVTVVDVDEATARGAAVQAAAVLTGRTVSDLRDEWRPAVVREVAPRSAPPDQVTERYARLAEQPDAFNHR